MVLPVVVWRVRLAGARRAFVQAYVGHSLRAPRRLESNWTTKGLPEEIDML